jgi:hypothetical protein
MGVSRSQSISPGPAPGFSFCKGLFYAMEITFGGSTKYWRMPTAFGKKSHITIYEPKIGSLAWTLCGRGVRFIVRPLKDEMKEVKGTECLNCLDALRAKQAEERASIERMRIFRNIPPKA